MTPKKGLGKGLSALISETNVAKIESDAKAGVMEIDINKVEPNRSQPRKHFDDESLRELADSIAEYGILQPLLVNKENEGYYSIVAGERRWRAARIAKLTAVPVIIKDYSQSETLQVALIENLQREDINPIEEALSYKRLIDEFFFTQEIIAAKIGKSRSSVSQCLSLLQLDERVQGMIADDMLNISAAKTLLKLEDGDAQIKAAMFISQENLPAAKAEKYINALLKEGEDEDGAQKEIKKPASNYPHLERDLNRIFGTKVKIKDGKNRGKIEIEYYSPDDLDRLMGIIKGQSSL
ncbi:MAG: ParB/RepB/Spo0J family partition protein [Clostridiales bacterium]|jgi:ParB family chromosome partitioning protein|nr:ParB/RepB/Spo0J family partition protein [Clostridiales bacterium]